MLSLRHLHVGLLIGRLEFVNALQRQISLLRSHYHATALREVHELLVGLFQLPSRFSGLLIEEMKLSARPMDFHMLVQIDAGQRLQHMCRHLRIRRVITHCDQIGFLDRLHVQLPG